MRYFFFNFSTFVKANTNLLGESLAISITSPNGGETLRIGQSYPIFWNSTPNIDKVSIAYKLSSGTKGWIANNISNSKVYIWKNINIGNSMPATLVKIFLVAYQTGLGSVTDESNNFFTVSSPTFSKTPLTSSP